MEMLKKEKTLKKCSIPLEVGIQKFQVLNKNFQVCPHFKLRKSRKPHQPWFHPDFKMVAVHINIGKTKNLCCHSCDLWLLKSSIHRSLSIHLSVNVLQPRFKAQKKKQKQEKQLFCIASDAWVVLAYLEQKKSSFSLLFWPFYWNTPLSEVM